MRKHILGFIKFAVSQIICGGILLAMFAWMAGTSLSLSHWILQYSWAMSSVLGMMWLVSLVGIAIIAVAMVKTLVLGYRQLRHDIQPYLVKPFSFRVGVAA